METCVIIKSNSFAHHNTHHPVISCFPAPQKRQEAKWVLEKTEVQPGCAIYIYICTVGACCIVLYINSTNQRKPHHMLVSPRKDAEDKEPLHHAAFNDAGHVAKLLWRGGEDGISRGCGCEVLMPVEVFTLMGRLLRRCFAS